MVEHCGQLKKLLPGDLVLANRGFKKVLVSTVHEPSSQTPGD